VAQSETLSRAMAKHNLDHELLNATQSAREAEIISLAAQTPRVSIATNMAGRGADIRLSEATRAAGGLHVIISEPHASPRIDRQLAGRCGRQGDPGTTRQYLAADDDLLRQTIGDLSIAIGPSIASSPTRVAALLSRKVKTAQALISRQQRNVRRQLAHGEAELRRDLETLGLDPHLDRIDLI
jgi:preprotein translocase subunit SecA